MKAPVNSSKILKEDGMAKQLVLLLGALAARAGGAPVISAAWRVTFWGALAMALTAGVGALFGIVA